MKYLFPVLFLGLVDSIESDYVVAEISNSQGEVSQLEIPVVFFPYHISEGDMFHILNIDGVTELRCGEPGV